MAARGGCACRSCCAGGDRGREVGAGVSDPAHGWNADCVRVKAGGRRARAPQPEFREWGAAQSSKSISVAADLGLAALLALFLLAAGDTFRRKLVALAGPTLAARRITVELLDEIDAQVQRYLLVMLVTNTLLGLCIWLLLSLLGMERAALWATVAGVLHIVPYAGTAVTTVAIGI